MIYNDGSTSTLYYYVLNAQGDVIALLNSAGSLVASYNYGAWGNYSVHDKDGKKNTSASFIGHINPLRYRGYYYDRETRLYYLQSRYYDFANYWFINADGLFTDGFVGSNLFAYCVNDPVNTVDPTGNFAITATVALITFGIALVATALAVGISSSPGFQGAVEDLCESVGDIAEQIKEKLTNSFAKIKKPPNYRRNDEVHHIVAQRATGADRARKILDELKIGIDEPINTVSINTCLHRRLHTKLYYELVDAIIVSAYNSAGGDREQQTKNVKAALGTIKAFIVGLEKITPQF
jgi:RHS repeat-associated protein